MSKTKHEFEAAGESFTWTRGRDKRVYVFRKGTNKHVTHFRQKKSNASNTQIAKERVQQKQARAAVRPEEREAPPEKRIFRSYIVLGYASADTRTEYRVWVHTDRANVTIADLEEWAGKLVQLFPTDIHLERFDVETNREIDEDEMVPAKDMGKYWGFAKFEKIRKGGGSKNYEYYAEQSGNDFSEVGGFRTPDI